MGHARVIALTKGGAVEAHWYLVRRPGILMSGVESDLEGCRKRKEKGEENATQATQTLEFLTMPQPEAAFGKNSNANIRSYHFMANRWGNSGNSGCLNFFWAPKSLQMVIAAMKLKDTCSLEGKL